MKSPLLRRAGLVAIVGAVGVAGAVIALTSPGSAATQRRALRYEVSVTNLTRGQIFSPAVVASHTPEMRPLFMGGQPASPELALVAEDAVLDPLVAALEASENVKDVVVLTGAGGPILPGETASVEIQTHGRASLISLVGMLVTTNDAFYGINGARGSLRGTARFLLPAYDAGSEANNELCSHIPGPPCGNAGVRDTAGAEGYVHIHAGVHGAGDLDPARHDWRNPVARLSIRRVPPGSAR